MRRAAFAAVVAACGGGAPPATIPVANTGAAALDVTPWKAVTLGAVFDLRDTHGKRVVGVVTAVEATPARRVIHLAWTNGEGGPPDIVELTATTVRFRYVLQEREASFPPDEVEVRGDGATCYVERLRGVECIDHCSNRFCVDAAKGLVGGYGFSWPTDSVFRP